MRRKIPKKRGIMINSMWKSYRGLLRIILKRRRFRQFLDDLLEIFGNGPPEERQKKEMGYGKDIHEEILVWLNKNLK